MSEPNLPQVHWCGDLRAVLEGGPFDPDPELESTDEPASPSKPAQNAA